MKASVNGHAHKNRVSFPGVISQTMMPRVLPLWLVVYLEEPGYDNGARARYVDVDVEERMIYYTLSPDNSSELVQSKIPEGLDVVFNPLDDVWYIGSADAIAPLKSIAEKYYALEQEIYVAYKAAVGSVSLPFLGIHRVGDGKAVAS